MLQGNVLLPGETVLLGIHRGQLEGTAVVREDRIEDTVYYTLFSDDKFILDLKVEGEKTTISDITSDRERFTANTMEHVAEFLLQHKLFPLSREELIAASAWFDTE